jgi:hypothetical protein
MIQGLEKFCPYMEHPEFYFGLDINHDKPARQNFQFKLCLVDNILESGACT